MLITYLFSLLGSVGTTDQFLQFLPSPPQKINDPHRKMDTKIIESETMAWSMSMLFAHSIMFSYGVVSKIAQHVKRNRRVKELKRRIELRDFDAYVEFVRLNSSNMSAQEIQNLLITPAVWGIMDAKIYLAMMMSRYGHDDVNAKEEEKIDKILEKFRSSENLLNVLNALNSRITDSSRSKEMKKYLENKNLENVWVDDWDQEFDCYGNHMMNELANVRVAIFCSLSNVYSFHIVHRIGLGRDEEEGRKHKFC